MRLTEFAPAHVVDAVPMAEPAPEVEPVQFGPPQWAKAAQMGGFPGTVFRPQPDGTLRCPTDQPLYPQERRPERDGSLRIVYAARPRSCCACLWTCSVFGGDSNVEVESVEIHQKR